VAEGGEQRMGGGAVEPRPEKVRKSRWEPSGRPTVKSRIRINGNE
jgi:hypothetical protein